MCLLLYIRIFWGRLIYVRTYRIIKVNIKVCCDMLKYAVVFWACVVLVCLDIFGFVWVRLGMFEYVK